LSKEEEIAWHCMALYGTAWYGEARMDGQDRRVKRTQNLLAKALIALTLEKGYESVTIREITEYADIGYATFFRHYHDKDALLRDVLDVVLVELTTLLLPHETTDDATTIGTLIFRYVRDHHEMVQVLLRSNSSAIIVKRVVGAGTSRVMLENSPKINSVVPMEIAANHLIASTIALIQWWLDHQMPYPAEHMGQIYHQLIAGPTREIAFG
jgi:AcrR family transcriptional regulator